MTGKLLILESIELKERIDCQIDCTNVVHNFARLQFENDSPCYEENLSSSPWPAFERPRSL
jgi:hypothetical protein